MADLAYREVYRMTTPQARRAMIETYRETGSLRATARIWQTTRCTVRKWVRRFEAEGEGGLEDRSHRPHHSPKQTSEELEQQVIEARKETGYGRKRLALYLRRQGVSISPDTIRHILRRNGLVTKRKRRKPLYPALWSWEQEEPFQLIQVDTKDVRDKGALGTALVAHLDRQHLPRYQWTARDGRSRIRFLAYSHSLNSTNGMAFLILTTLWLRAHGITGEITFQTDWGQEFGGDNPARIARLETQFLQPLQARLTRYPIGRKGYNGRVERSHRTDDEEFYRPYLTQIEDVAHWVRLAGHWVYFYNAVRPHTGKKMDNRTPLQVLRQLGYRGGDTIAYMPPIVLDDVSADILLSFDPEYGYHLLTQYTLDQATSSSAGSGVALDASWLAWCRPRLIRWSVGSMPRTTTATC